MDSTSVVPQIPVPVPKKGGLGKAIKWLVIIGVLAGIAFAAYTFLMGETIAAGRFYPEIEGVVMRDLPMMSVYEFQRGRREVVHDMGIMRTVFNYRVRGDRLILTSGGESIEFRLGSDRNYFIGPLNMKFVRQN